MRSIQIKLTTTHVGDKKYCILFNQYMFFNNVKSRTEMHIQKKEKLFSQTRHHLNHLMMVLLGLEQPLLVSHWR